MHIKSLDLQGFMGHSSTSLVFPERGVVAVTGPNGAGKSALIEGVAFGLHGRTLRENDPWTGKGLVHVGTTGVHVTRARKGRGVVLSFDVGAESRAGLTATKGQELLDPHLMPWDVWRRACAFSSSDVAHFSLASDGNQKRLIESLLGLEAFDPALKACRADLADIRRKLERAEHRHEKAKLSLEAARQRLADTEKHGGEAPPQERIAEAQRKTDALGEQWCTQRKLVNEALERRRDVDRRAGEARSHLRHLKAQLDKLDAQDCPVCGQAIPEVLVEKLRADIEDVEMPDTGEIETELEALKVELERLDREYNAAQDEWEELREQRSRADSVKGAAKEAGLAIASAQKEITEASAQIARHELDVAELMVTEKVLGLRGVRPMILGHALDGLDTIADTWLARIAGEGLRIKLRAWTETKTAGISDKFSLVVEGAGGGSYKGASAGQRRRIDTALLFALSEMAAASRGTTPGTLFVDEVFDVLDDEGVEAVSEAMREVAEDRCVVVVTHRPSLVQALQPVRQWHVINGKVDER